MNGELLVWLAESTLLSSAAIVVVLCVRPLIQKFLCPRSMIMIWALVPLVVLVTTLPDRVVDIADGNPNLVLTLNLDQFATTTVPAPGATPGNAGHSLEVIGTLWLAGSISLFLLMVRRQRRFRSQLGQLQQIGKRLYRTEHSLHGPLLLGILAPRIIVPENFERCFNVRQRRLILAHEYTHLKRFDPLWSLIAAGLRCLFWFNPLVHWSASRFRRDQELACDAQVLASRRRSRRTYASALLALASHSRQLPVLAFGPHPLKERIMNLSALKPETPVKRCVGMLAVLGIALTLAGMAWAMTPDQTGRLDAGDELPNERFSFDIEVTVDNQTQVGRLAFAGDVGTYTPGGEQPRLWASKRLTLVHEAETSGWASEIDIQRINHDQFEVNARILKDGEIVGTPRMIIGTESPAMLESVDPATGEPAYRIKLIPFSEGIEAKHDN